MFNPRTKFEVSTITYNKGIKVDVEILVLNHPLGDSGVTHRVHLWLDGKRIVNFLVVIIGLFSLALTAEALLSEPCRNRRFLKGWVTLSANLGRWGRRPQSIYGP